METYPTTSILLTTAIVPNRGRVWNVNVDLGVDDLEQQASPPLASFRDATNWIRNLLQMRRFCAPKGSTLRRIDELELKLPNQWRNIRSRCIELGYSTDQYVFELETAIEESQIAA